MSKFEQEASIEVLNEDIDEEIVFLVYVGFIKYRGPVLVLNTTYEEVFIVVRQISTVRANFWRRVYFGWIGIEDCKYGKVI